MKRVCLITSVCHPHTRNCTLLKRGRADPDGIRFSIRLWEERLMAKGLLFCSARSLAQPRPYQKVRSELLKNLDISVSLYRFI